MSDGKGFRLISGLEQNWSSRTISQLYSIYENPLGDVLVRILKFQIVILPFELTAARAQSSGRQEMALTLSPVAAPPSASP